MADINVDNKKEYSKILTNPEWQKRRLEIFNRDNWTCQGCGDKTTQLEVHHVDYWGGKKPWEYPEDMLITVCHNCHGKENIRFKHEKHLLNALRMRSFLAVDVLALASLISSDARFCANIKTRIKEFSK